MTKPLQILIPLAAPSPFFDPAEFFFPKPLVDVGGKSMIEYTLSALQATVENARFLFLVRQEDIAKFSIDSILRLRAGEDSVVIPIAASTQGALCSCLLAVDQLDLDAPLLISNGDQVVESDLSQLFDKVRETGAAAGVVTFPSVHPRWSYVRTGSDGNVSQAAEKSVISENAIAGLYYFETARTFIEAAKDTIRANDRVGGQFFIAPSLNQVILKGETVTAVSIPETRYHSFYTPSKFHEYVEGLERRAQSYRMMNTVVVVPAAGEGSRFAKAGWKRPKPFIDVGGKSMIEHVLDNARPKGSKLVTLLRSEHVAASPDVVARIETMADVVKVEKLTEGTLCTIMLARRYFNDDDAVLVANSDQVIDFSVDDFIEDCRNRNLDGSILVFRDRELNPKWSFARINSRGLVEEVAEKKPISDLATVGVYFFRRAGDLFKATIDMIANNDRVNNEFYTCPVYNYMIREGARIGVYEVPADAMHGLGVPEDLRTYLDHQGLAKSADEPDA